MGHAMPRTWFSIGIVLVLTLLTWVNLAVRLAFAALSSIAVMNHPERQVPVPVASY